MTILIIEDERLAVEKLMQTLHKIRPNARVIAVLDSIAASVSWFSTHQKRPDLILMDIELADGHSFAIFEQVTIESMVIFVTSYDEYALKAFKVNSVDYLLKPIQQNELALALEKLERMQTFYQEPPPSYDFQKLLQALQKSTASSVYRKRFLVKHLKKLIPVEVSRISYFFHEDRVTFFKTPQNSNYIVDYTVDDLETMLDPDLFFRINRGIIVSIDCIEQINPYFGNRLEIKLKPAYNKEAIVSREKVGDFKLWLGR